MSVELIELISKDTQIKVSSTLDKSVGRKYLVDRNPETCWTSQPGLPQWIQLIFDSPVLPSHLFIIFQGGFVGTHCKLSVTPATSHERFTDDTAAKKREWQELMHIYPEDVNRKQAFDIPSSPLMEHGITRLKLAFNSSSDLFGRITIYNLQVEGTTLSANESSADLVEPSHIE